MNIILKKTSIATAVILFILSLNCTNIASTLPSEPIWGVSPGDTYDFNLNYIEIDCSLPLINYNGTGLTFANDSFVEQNSTISFNITNIDEIQIDYNLTNNGINENNYRISSNFSNELSFLLNLPFKFISEEVNISDIKRGFTGIDYLIVPTLNETWDEFDSYDNPIYLTIIEEAYASEAEINLEGLTTISQVTDESIFDWYVNGTYVDEANGTNFQFVYSLKMAYELSTGILLGMRVSLEIEGENCCEPTSIIIHSEVERNGYSLGDFLLPSGENSDIARFLSDFLPGFGWIIVPIVFAPLILVKNKKRERK